MLPLRYFVSPLGAVEDEAVSHRELLQRVNDARAGRIDALLVKKVVAALVRVRRSARLGLEYHDVDATVGGVLYRRTGFFHSVILRAIVDRIFVYKADCQIE
jgi:hypothetical protein